MILPLQTRGGQFNVTVEPNRVILLLIDVWDNHWCASGWARMQEIVPKINEFALRFRALGGSVIHAPSGDGVMEFYKGLPQREVMRRPLNLQFPRRMEISTAPPLATPPHDPGTGCSCEGHACEQSNTFTRQHSGIAVEESDRISSDPYEIYLDLHLRDPQPEIVLVAGFHTNYCVVDRPFGLRALAQWGRNPVLLSDLTDGSFQWRPDATHEEMQAAYLAHIRDNLCPIAVSGGII